ncbi:hypothetical protein AVEN_155388-1, partial [Araneus ventricosus]
MDSSYGNLFYSDRRQRDNLMYSLSGYGFYPSPFAQEHRKSGMPVMALPSMNTSQNFQASAMQIQNQRHYQQKASHLQYVNLHFPWTEKYNRKARYVCDSTTHFSQNNVLQSSSDLQPKIRITDNNPLEFFCEAHSSVPYVSKTRDIPQNSVQNIANKTGSLISKKCPFFSTVKNGSDSDYLADLKDKSIQTSENCSNICRSESIRKNSSFASHKQKTVKKRIRDRSRRTVKQLLACVKSQNFEREVGSCRNNVTDFSILRHQLATNE